MISSVLQGFSILLLSSILFKYYPNISKILGSYTKPEGVDVTQSSKPTGSGIIFPLVLFFYVLINLQDFDFSISFLLLSSSCLLIALMGFFDDIYSLSLKLRLLCQTLFVVLLIGIFFNHTFIESSLGDLMFILTILFLGIWLLNSFNFIDGADGLLAINSLMICLTISAYCLFGNQASLGFMLLNFCIVLFSFLIFNWHPSKLFMGDAGSLFLGSVSLILIMYLYSYGVLKISTLFIVFSLIIIETTCTLLVRIYRKENFFSGRHDLHAYQQLAKQPNKGALPAKISILLTVLWIVPMGFLSHVLEGKETIVVLVSSFPLFLLSYFYGPYKTIKDDIF